MAIKFSPSVDHYSNFDVVATYRPKDAAEKDKFYSKQVTVVSFIGTSSTVWQEPSFVRNLRSNGVHVPSQYPGASSIPEQNISGTYKRVVTLSHALFFDVLRIVLVNESCGFEKLMFRQQLPKTMTHNTKNGAVTFELTDVNIQSTLPFAPEGGLEKPGRTTPVRLVPSPAFKDGPAFPFEGIKA